LIGSESSEILVMGWGFEAVCPDCRHRWEGVETSFHLGHQGMSAASGPGEPDRSLFCPRCFHRLYIPRAIEKSVWRRWIEAFRAGPFTGSSFLGDLIARIDEALSTVPYYVPQHLELGPIDCPDCGQAFEESSEGTLDRLVCPKCQGRGAILNGYNSHCSMLVGEDGFY